MSDGENTKKRLSAELAELRDEVDRLRRREVEHRRREKNLRQSEIKHRQVVDNANDGVAVIQNGLIVFANRQTARLAGRSVEELTGSSIFDLLHPDDRNRAVENYRRRITGEPIEDRPRYRAAVGEVTGWVEVSGAKIDWEGRPANLVFISDVTERVRAERELKESEERYRLLFNTGPDMVSVHLLHDDGNYGNFVEVNDVLCQVFGYTREELLAMTPVDMADPEVLPLMSATRDKLLAQGNLFFRTVFLAKDRSPRPVEVNANLFNWQGQQAILSVTRDLRERQALEEQLLQAQKMEAIGQLAGGVAHDFNNLLTIISGYSDVAFHDLSPADPLYADLQGIHNAAQRAAALTRQLLAFSRRQILEPRVIDLNHVLTDLDQMLQRLIGEDVELRVELGPEAGSIKVDPGQLEQVIMNLAVNARDAMPQGGRLTIETAPVELDDSYAEDRPEVTPGPHAMLAVSDTGKGMPKEVASRIFEPFFTTKTRGKGTGLGLSTVYGIVKQSGGHIFVYSELGQGTTFKIYFPRFAEAGRRVEAAARRTGVAGGSETILVVEDEDSVRRLAAQILKRYGYQVIEAANGGEAVLACERHPGGIDLLLTDVVMPHMSGREVAERIRQEKPDIRVIYVSGYTDNAIAHHGVLEKGINFLSKPFSAEGLAKKIRQVLDQD